jgi:4-carboxymuconolactone decarboxylase
MSDGVVTPTPRSRTAPNRTWGPAGFCATLRGMAEGEGSTTTADRDEARTVDTEALDERTAAVARLAASLALRAPPAFYRRSIDDALAAGATVDDVVGTLTVVARTVGLARVVSAAPDLALAVGYDVDDALETLDDPRAADARGPAGLA